MGRPAGSKNHVLPLSKEASAASAPASAWKESHDDWLHSGMIKHGRDFAAIKKNPEFEKHFRPFPEAILINRYFLPFVYRIIYSAGILVW